MIRAYVGKPGGGKTYRALVKEIVEELLYGNRFVITNVSVLPEELAAYFHENHGGAEFVDLHKRLRILTDEETKKFWLHPRPGVDIEDTSDKEQERGIFPDFTPYPSVLFVCDEAHKHFDARSYQSEGHALTHVNSQHRKLDWDIVFITQFPELISKRIKGFVQEWHDCRNFAVERIFNVFQMPKRFYVKVTQREPSEKRDDPGNYEYYKIDLKLAKCYDTSAGVGIKGRKLPERKKKDGLNLFWLLVPFCLLMGGLFYGPDLLAKAAMSTDRGQKIKQQFDGTLSKNGANSNQANRSSSVESGGAIAAPNGARPPAPGSDVSTRAVPIMSGTLSPFAPGVFPTGYAVRGGVVHVILSDGTSIVQGVSGMDDGVRIEGVHRNGVVINGHKFFFKKPPLREPAPVQSPPAAPVPELSKQIVGPAVGEVRHGRVYAEDGTWRIPADSSVNRFGRQEPTTLTAATASLNVKKKN